jgi:dihydroorotate dehydrogenase electron transfer subunit
MVISAGLAREAAPGRFVMIKCGGAAYLRRPLSFCDADEKAGTVTFLYRAGGAGTRELSLRKRGEYLDINGPLGAGYKVSGGKSAIVGGGIGAAPLLLLAKRLCEQAGAPDVFLGFQNAESVLLKREFSVLCDNFILMSDDGSAGEKGLVTDAFLCALEAGAAYGNIYACGPVQMYKALKRICGARGLSAQASFEQRMGCGIGACLVCACAVSAAPGPFMYKRVCADGPVFQLETVIFDD